MTRDTALQAHKRMRRRSLRALAALLLPSRAIAAQRQSESGAPPALTHTPYAQVVPGYVLRFPHDEGSHPNFRIEWWYVTGWLTPAARAEIGFQITFFRVRPRIDEGNPSAFTAHQIMIAHAALSDAGRGRLLHDQRVQRAALGLAGAEVGRTHVWIDDWSLTQDGSVYRARIPAAGFSLDLGMRATQPPLLHGEHGVSRKGPQSQSASYYYSIPHLDVNGTLQESGRTTAVKGRAWLDHEWSSSYMDERAQGWDWIGINLDDGGALMAFRMRTPSGELLWAGATYRDRAGTRTVYSPDQLELAPKRLWQSPRTGATYPVAWRVRIGAIHLTLEPVMNDQESDTRATVGAVYWEGAVRAFASGQPVGHGYLELTGYVQPLRL